MRINSNETKGALITLAAAGAGTSQSPDQINQYGKGIKVVIDITVVGGAPTLTVTIQGRDRASGKYFTILASAALTAVGTTVLTVYPGLTASANVVANDVIPEDWRITAVIGGTTPAVTATVSAQLIS